jgi:hypothetical protein
MSKHEIFLVPHAHCDVGWEWTIFGYYNNSVRHTLDSVTRDLGAHPTHRFIWSETKWIEMWWPHQNAATRATFKRIVANGQFEFVGAGWSQSDEVTPSYRDIISNTVTGHEYLRRILGPLDKACPVRGNGRCIRFGWQIDMFAGYSATTPSLWAMAGYDGMVNRFEGPNDMRVEWDAQQNYEFLWEGSEVLASNRSRILTHTIRWNYGDMLLANRSGPAYGYRGPAGLTFDFSTRKLHSQKDVVRYAKELVFWSKHRGSVYRGNRHMAAWGSDFQFTNAGLWFEQMDLIVAEINRNPVKYGNTHVQYSTLSTYFDYLHELTTTATTNTTFPVKRGLDFQYGWPHTWSPVGVPLIGLTQNFSWQFQTGALSSRPAHKRHVRTAAAELRAAQAAYAIALGEGTPPPATAGEDFMVSWDAIGIMQHHDSLPGTMRNARAVEDPFPDNVPIANGIAGMARTTDPTRLCLEDYTARLQEADAATGKILRSSLEATAGMTTGSLRKNGILGDGGLLLFNPTFQARSELVRMEWSSQMLDEKTRAPVIPTVVDRKTGRAVTAQVDVNDYTKTQNTASHHALPTYATALYFVAKDVPPLGIARFELSFDVSGANSTTTVFPTITVGAANVAAQGGLQFNDSSDSECLHAEFDPVDGLLSQIRVGCADARSNSGGKAKQTTIQVRQTYWQYLDGGGGAYCMIEQTPAVQLPRPFRVTATKGPVMQEVVQTFAWGDGLQQRTRIVIGKPRAVDVIHVAGTVPGDRELISRLETDLSTASAGTDPGVAVAAPTRSRRHAGRLFVSPSMIHTEASGMRELYPRSTNVSASISQNYHSMVQSAIIRDEGTNDIGSLRGKRELSLLTRRTMGVASLGQGELEYMLMRRVTAASDNQGPWPLDDLEPMEEDHMRLIVGMQDEVESIRFSQAMALEQPLAQFYYDTKSRSQEHDASTRTGRRGLLRTPSSSDPRGGLPSGVWAELMVRMDPPNPNATFMLRLQNMNNATAVVSSVAKMLGLAAKGCEETSLTMQQTRVANDATRLTWPADSIGKLRPSSRAGEESRRERRGVLGCDNEIELYPLDVRTFTFGV